IRRRQNDGVQSGKAIPCAPGAFVTKRAYAAPEPRDGTRVLVDRLWPRGLRKDKASIDLWMKDIALSAGLRRWFHQDPARWSAFRQRYGDELRAKASLVDQLRQHGRTRRARSLDLALP